MSEWLRVSRRKPCAVCSRSDWCTVSANGSVACCMRVESSKQLHNGGWLHRLCENGDWQGSYVGRVAVVERRTPKDFGRLAERYERAACDAKVARFAGELSVSFESLRRLHVGWDGTAWTFPMTSASGTVTGIRRRFPDGRKLSVKGGREGLFVPNGLPERGALLVCEGPTDCAALLTLYSPAIGRPSCRGGVRLLCEFCRGRPVVVLADGDEPGRIGASVLAQALRLYCLSVRIVRPPLGMKDTREWVRRGGTMQEIQRRIAAAQPVKLTVTTKPAPFTADPGLRRYCHA